ncbi:MAG: tripartite tricarboxylate transporter TctB family protein [Syntrophales bacterium]|nr:tripartite tricarboxylate transporter TctB family protein [Syntrophales bacterium]
MRKSGDIVVGLFFLAIGIVFMIGAIKLQVGVPTEPRPGFFPFIDGAILIVLSGLFLIQAWGGKAGESQAFGKMGGPILVVLTLILYVATIDTLGYVITTTILSAVVLKVMETKPRVLVLVSLILAVVSYLLFDRLLGVTLPRGLLAAFF